jgi:hypothetical protein
MIKKRPNIIYWIGLMLVAAFTFYQCLNLYKDITARNWSSVDGQINWQARSAGPFRNERRGNIIGSLHWKEVQFSYKVDGVQYSSNNLSFGLTFGDGSELVNPYDKEQSEVKIFINPLNPREAVLIPGPKAFNICLVVLGAFFTFWLLKRIRRN